MFDSFKKIIFFGVFLTLGYSLNAQHYSIEGMILVGKLVKHKPDLLFDDPGVNYGFEIDVVRESLGYKPWERYWGNPELEGTFVYLNFGDPQVLGQAIGIIPGVRIKLFDKTHWRAKVHFGVGFGYLTKTYDKISNQKNNAIGSHFNNASRLKLVLSYKKNDRHHVFLGAGVNHFSNGLSVSPNSGINVFTATLGARMRWMTRSFDESKVVPMDTNNRSWHIIPQVGIGFTEATTPGGPNYPVYYYSVAGGYDISPFQTLILGFEHEFHTGIFEFQKHIFTEEDRASKLATRTSIIIADELFLADFGFRFQAGIYLDYPLKQEGDRVFFKLESNYYPPFLAYRGIRPYVGFLLKSHYSVAEYVAIASGFRF